MKVEQGLQFKQSQSLAMTPRLQQAIKLLQGSSQEVMGYIEEQLLVNPLLERVENSEVKIEVPAAEDPLAELYSPDYANVWDQGRSDEGDNDSDGLIIATHSGFESEDDYDRWHNNSLKSVPSLHDYLRQQIYPLLPDEPRRRIADYLIDMVSETGYLDGDLWEASEDLGVLYEDMVEVFEICQTAEPVGVFARTLAECLRMQLKDKGELTAKMDEFLEHLDLVFAGDLQRLARSCQLSLVETRSYLDIIRTLHPKPGLAYVESPSEVVIPDVIMRRVGKDGWRIDMNEEALPRLLVNSSYYKELTAVVKRPEDRNYIETHFSNANWLIKALLQRTQTILSVSKEIIRRQEAFFEEGAEALQPLVLREIAAALDLHESTISRATVNKYIATPRGVFELRYFFSSGIASTTHDESHAAKAIQHRIRTLVLEENKAVPFSDEQLVAELKREGISVARRTVTKYREALNIGSSVERRRMYQIREK